MAIELSDQQQKVLEFESELDELRSILEERKIVWDKLSEDQKEKWIEENKDGPIGLAYRIYVYLENYFEGLIR